MRSKMMPRVGRTFSALVFALALIAPVLVVQALPATSTTIHAAGVAKTGVVVVKPAASHTLRPVSATTKVYITRTGAKYHRSNCRYLRYSKIKVTLKYAKSHGYGACKICRPPTR